MKHAIAVDARVVYHDIKRSIGVHGILHQRRNFFLFGYVHGVCRGFSASFLNFADGLVSRNHIRQDNRRAFLGKLKRNPFSQSSTSARYNRNFSLQPHRNTS